MAAAPKPARPEFRIEGGIGDGNNTAAAVAAFLGQHPGKDVRVIVNSPGGSATEGAAILAEFEAHGRVTGVVRGLAASSASLALCGCKEVILHPAALWMAHLPWMMTIGDERDHRAAAEVLETVGRSDAAVYARFSGHPVARIRAWLAEELWLSAEEAVALNFADALEEGARAEPPAQHDYTKHANAPQALQRLARKNGWAADPSEQQTEQ